MNNNYMETANKHEKQLVICPSADLMLFSLIDIAILNF